MSRACLLISHIIIIPLVLLVSAGAPAQQLNNAGGPLAALVSDTSPWLKQLDITHWRVQLKQDYIEKIQRLPPGTKATLAARADKALAYDWPAMPAGLFLEYKQTGNRTRYEKKLNERRDLLNNLAIGELVTGNGKYLIKLVDGIWATLEESTWEIPAIVAIQEIGKELPDPHDQVIGLVSAETAAMLAAIQFMLSDQLDKVSPVINKRIGYELDKRIFGPYMQREDYWWMGFKGQAVNNWNAWINTNVLHTALFTEPDTAKLVTLVSKVLRSTDHFIGQYPADGGCEEGAAYWSLAGGKLSRMLRLLKDVSHSDGKWLNNQLLHNIGTYIYKVHIDDRYFVNFADASARTVPNPVSVYQFGKLFNDDSMKHFSSYLFSLKQRHIPDSNIVDFLETVEVFDSVISYAPKAVQPSFAALPDIQVFTARTTAENKRGLFLAVQGGHNAESHNHNDVGNFLIYAGGRPVIIDAGVGTYTAQTFSDARYELWNMQSQWHNCPDINGVMQKNGKSFRAAGVSFINNSNEAAIRMEIAGAYPPEAFVGHWKREFLFDRSRSAITLTDVYSLGKRVGKTKQHFLSSCEIRLLSKGSIGFYDRDGKNVLLLNYHPNNLVPVIEKKILDDEKLINEWGKSLYRLSLIDNSVSLKSKNRFTFTLPDTSNKLTSAHK